MLTIEPRTLERERRIIAGLASAYLAVARTVASGRAVSVDLRDFELEALALASLLLCWGQPPMEARPS